MLLYLEKRGRASRNSMGQLTDSICWTDCRLPFPTRCVRRLEPEKTAYSSNHAEIKAHYLRLLMKLTSRNWLPSMPAPTWSGQIRKARPNSTCSFAEKLRLRNIRQCSRSRSDPFYGTWNTFSVPLVVRTRSENDQSMPGLSSLLVNPTRRLHLSPYCTLLNATEPVLSELVKTKLY